jgi:hypothetical protein
MARARRPWPAEGRTAVHPTDLPILVADAGPWIEVALVIFLAVFLIVVLAVVLAKPDRFTKASRIPLDDEAVIEPRRPARPEPQERSHVH